MLKVQPEAPTASPATDERRDQLAGLSIVSALVNGVQVPVACPAAWCTEDHASENTQHAEDIDHAGDNADLHVPNFHGGEDLIFAYAHLGQDTYASDPKMRAAHIRVEDGGGEASYLTPDQADTFGGYLTTFGSQIRALAHVARGAQSSEPGHYPWCTRDTCTTYDGEDGPITEHHSPAATIQAPDGFQAENGRILHAYLLADDSFIGTVPAVSVVDATGSGTLLGADALDELIDQTAAALAQLRTMRLQMAAARS